MASNSFGTLFKITTWGESHGKAIGVVIDGCPAGLEICDEEVNFELTKRRGGNSLYTTPRKEPDLAQILSGTFEGKTTGAPISIIIYNQNIDSSKYEPIKDLLRPGHANYTYLDKYGIFDYRGGGRASARETACRVAASAVAKKLLKHFNIETIAYIKEIGGISIENTFSFYQIKENTFKNEIFCPDHNQSTLMMEKIKLAKEQKDSLGGVVEVIATGLPVGLGDPVYEKLEAKLSSAMLSIPASKGFEIGEGFNATKMQGSFHNDAFELKDNKAQTSTNHAGGTLGGISTGSDLVCRVAFKPTSSIGIKQKTVSLDKKEENFKLPKGSRHDPCVAIRGVSVVDAMMSLVLVDAILLNQSSSLKNLSI